MSGRINEDIWGDKIFDLFTFENLLEYEEHLTAVLESDQNLNDAMVRKLKQKVKMIRRRVMKKK